MKCIEEEHEYDFIGFMVVADKMPKKSSNSPPVQTAWGLSTVGWSGPRMNVPQHFPAKIEVHQCRKCGNIKLQPAVFTRILQGDKN